MEVELQQVEQVVMVAEEQALLVHQVIILQEQLTQVAVVEEVEIIQALQAVQVLLYFAYQQNFIVELQQVPQQ